MTAWKSSTPVIAGSVESDGKTALYEYGRRRLGYGEWDELLSEEPYWKWVGMAAHRLALTMKKRRVTPTDWRLAVDFCARHRIPIGNPVWALKYIPEAKTENQRLARERGLPLEVDDALAYERNLADPMSAEWVQKLLRARGPYRKEVLAEWQRSRNHEKELQKA